MRSFLHSHFMWLSYVDDGIYDGLSVTPKIAWTARSNEWIMKSDKQWGGRKVIHSGHK